MVISGIWKCCEKGEWSFNVDKERQSRVVPVADGVTLPGLLEVVKKEFGVTSSLAAQLSYWAPSSLSFATGKKTPPVMVTTDVGLDYYLKLAKVNKGLNMFVSFPGRSKRENESKGSAEGIVEGQTSSESLRKRMCGTYEVLGDVSTAGSKVVPLVSSNDNIDDETIRILEDLSSGRLNLEDGDSMKGKNGGLIVSEFEGLCSTEDDDLSSCDDVIASPVEEVAPEGYDKEFWGNFIEEELGGSNAVEVMCSGNGAFDHMVIVGGGVSAKPDVEDVNLGHKGECSDPGGQVGVVGNRKLEDIDNEEFDIPPLFDDTEYERTEIPDLDRDDGNGIYKGKVFATKEDCQIGLVIYAIKNMFHFRQSVTKRNYFVCICTDEKYDWRVRADEMVESGYYEIRKAQLEHRCSIETRKHYMKKATSRVIAAVYKAQYSEPVKGPKPMDLQQLVLENLRVSASYSKCRRAREKAVEEIQGGDGDSYTKLAKYLHLLKIANPGTVTDIVTDIEDDGSKRFVYMFLAFGASIAGFKHVRRILVVDGTHLTGRYKGVLLTACGQDANFQVFPLAFAIVDSENDDSWTWFFQKIERILADSPGLTIISDRHFRSPDISHGTP